MAAQDGRRTVKKRRFLAWAEAGHPRNFCLGGTPALGIRAPTGWPWAPQENIPYDYTRYFFAWPQIKITLHSGGSRAQLGSLAFDVYYVWMLNSYVIKFQENEGKAMVEPTEEL